MSIVSVRAALQTKLNNMTPALATIGLFLALGYWNEWYYSSLFLGSQVRYRPLQYQLYNIINKVAALRENSLRLYHGSVDEYLERHHREQDAAGGKSLTEKTAPTSSRKDQKRKEAERRQDRYRHLKPLKDERARIEREIHGCEKRREEIENAFSNQDTYQDEALIQALHIEYPEVTSRLASLYDRWAETEEEIDHITRDD